MSQDRIGRYRVTRRVVETSLEVRRRDARPANAGTRLLCEAQRQGDDAQRRLYVITVESPQTREILANSFLACTALKHERVVRLLDAGSFGERVYAAMSVEGLAPLSRIAVAIEAMPVEIRTRILASIGSDAALGLVAGHDLGGRGLVHDALDLESIFVDEHGRASIDSAFLDPWIASETIAMSAASFVAPDRWTPPCKSASDAYALAAILARLGGAKDLATVSAVRGLPDGVASTLSRSPTTRATEMKELRDRLLVHADLEGGRSALADLFASLDGPMSRTAIGIGRTDDMDAKTHVRQPAGAPRGVALPRVNHDDDDAPPATSRMGSLAALDEEAENDATVVERSPFFDDDKPKGPKPDEKTPIAFDIPRAAESLRSQILDQETNDEEDGSTVVAPLWSAAMAKASSSDAPSTADARKGPAPRPAARTFGLRSSSNLPKVAIPKTPPFPVEPAKERRRIANPGNVPAPPRSAPGPGIPRPMIGGLPVLWSDEASPEPDEVATRLRARSDRPPAATASESLQAARSPSVPAPPPAFPEPPTGASHPPGALPYPPPALGPMLSAPNREPAMAPPRSATADPSFRAFLVATVLFVLLVVLGIVLFGTR